VTSNSRRECDLHHGSGIWNLLRICSTSTANSDLAHRVLVVYEAAVGIGENGVVVPASKRGAGFILLERFGSLVLLHVEVAVVTSDKIDCCIERWISSLPQDACNPPLASILM
jgi:hypothetical protein